MTFQKPVVRAAYGYDTDKVSDETGLVCADPSLTVQADREEADINVILDRFGITGTLPQNVRPPTFQDFGDAVFDFRSAVEAVAMAQDAFMSMPARVRSRFDNDPQKFLEFCSPDAENGTRYSDARLKELRELGLATPAKPVVAEPAKPA